ncbi:type IV secretion system DNA-binding domain-containing protein [Patescibacteria group bacterium]|nr:type IV secretion system DNA-binding domain-containing protein [Patescibacteria group bacterium]MBU1922210.1 type IV secretion system DNA-binding domain-containing protein [Patescibacteria group bacterium]
MIDYGHDHENEITLFAQTNFRNKGRRFGIKTDDRRKHVYILGKTGVGKTTLLENMMIADINAGHGLAIVDPHGDTAEKLLNFIPPHRINDVIYLNPADSAHPIGFNVLESVDEDHRHLIANGLMGVFLKIWPDVWSARMEYILNNCILALLEYPGSTLLGINRILIDPEYRKRVVSQIKDPVVKTFWVDEYARWESRFRNEAIAPIQNKVGQFLSASIIRNIVAQVKSSFDPRAIMDEGKIFIMNLSKGRIGEDTSKLLGGMLITKFQLAAMERVDTPEEDRRDFYLYVDEFQNFATESFANILSEARKYHLNLTMAHQYVEQLSEEVTAAVFGNVGTILLFRIGATDAEVFKNEFFPKFSEMDLVNQNKYNIYIKLSIDGITSEPFSAQGLPPISGPTGSEEKVIKVSRERYTEKRSVIEDKVLRWIGTEVVKTDKGDVLKTKTEIEGRPPEESAKKRKKPLYTYTCTKCGKEQELAIQLDTSRPIYCQQCLEDMKKGKRKEPPRERPAVAPRISQTPLATKEDEPKEISLSEAFKKSPDNSERQPSRPGPPIKPASNTPEPKPLKQNKNTLKPGDVVNFE